MRRLAVLIPSLAAILAPAAPADAFYVEGRPLTDGGAQGLLRYAETAPGVTDIEYRYSPDGAPAITGAEAAIAAAFASWDAVPCTTTTFHRGTDIATVERFTFRHWDTDAGVIYIAVYFTNSPEEWASGAAVGHFWYGQDADGTTLRGASLLLNTRDYTWATDGTASALDVQSVVTAFIGRAFGLTSAIPGNATYPSYSPGNIDKRTLGADDIAGISYLYPSGAVGCAAPAAPVAICDGTAPRGVCPPLPGVMPLDGGTADLDGGIIVASDSGPAAADSGFTPTDSGFTATDSGSTGRDAGTVRTDAGTGTGGDGGCGCRVAGPPTGATGAIAGAALALLTVLVRRRRGQ